MKSQKGKVYKGFKQKAPMSSGYITLVEHPQLLWRPGFSLRFFPIGLIDSVIDRVLNSMY